MTHQSRQTQQALKAGAEDEGFGIYAGLRDRGAGKLSLVWEQSGEGNAV